MKLQEIMQLDLRKKGNEIKLRKALIKSFPPFKKRDVDNLPPELLEKAIRKIAKKYEVGIAYIMSGPSDTFYYSFMLKSMKTHEHITTIHCITLYEGLAKSIICLIDYIKKGGKK